MLFLCRKYLNANSFPFERLQKKNCRAMKTFGRGLIFRGATFEFPFKTFCSFLSLSTFCRDEALINSRRNFAALFEVQRSTKKVKHFTISRKVISGSRVEKGKRHVEKRLQILLIYNFVSIRKNQPYYFFGSLSLVFFVECRECVF